MQRCRQFTAQTRKHKDPGVEEYAPKRQGGHGKEIPPEEEAGLPLTAVNSNGTFKWSYPTGNSVASTPALGHDGTVYIGSGDSYFYALTSAEAMKWSFPMAGISNTGPSIGPDGTVYMTGDGAIWTLYGTTPLATSPWPKFHHNLRQTGRQP